MLPSFKKRDFEAKVAVRSPYQKDTVADVYISVDIETDGPIPGPFSMLSFAMVEVGVYDGVKLVRPPVPRTFYRELKPISDQFEAAAMAVNGLDRTGLSVNGGDPGDVMREARQFVAELASQGTPVMVAYPLSFDWSFLYWYFVSFGNHSPFNHSRCFDVKTAVAVKGHRMITQAGRDLLPDFLKGSLSHTHHALDDAIEQAEIFARVFDWDGEYER